MRCADFVVFCLFTFCMIRAVHLYYQHPVKAHKIYYIIIYNMLSSKIQP